MKHVITQEIIRFLGDYQELKSVRTRWGEPLAGFADAEDSLFLQLKDAVSPTHAMPGDLLENARTVIAYFLPFDKEIPKKNRHHFHAAKEWAVAYVETNQLIIDINRHLSQVLKEKGFSAAILPPTHNFDKKKLMSDWSHKHAAYIAGLGKFGVHHMLITEKGCCGRLGTLITDAEIPATERNSSEYCLYKHNKTCAVCVKKCVGNALTLEQFDRHKCYQFLLENAKIYENEGIADVCGKCASIVPCSFHNPVGKLLKS